MICTGVPQTYIICCVHNFNMNFIGQSVFYYFVFLLLTVPDANLIRVRDPYYHQDYDGHYYPSSPSPPTGLPPQGPPCTGFPGSPQWDQCWNLFQSQLGAFQQQFQPHGSTRPGAGWNQSLPSYGPTTSMFLNGYTIRANGLSINSNSVNGQLYIEAYVGPGRVDVTRDEHTLKYEVMNGRRIPQWITVTPPRSISINSIRHDTRDQNLRIWAEQHGEAELLGTPYGDRYGGYVSSGAPSSMKWNWNPFF